MKNHLIIGFGKWSKKIIHFLEKKKIFNKIYVKNRTNYFEYSKNFKYQKISLNKIKKDINSIHICTPLKSHYFYLKKFINIQKIIVEKPFLQSIDQINNIEKLITKKKLIYVNYTYLFNSFFIFLKKKIKNSGIYEITINFSQKNNFYKKKYDCLKDWLDHPLSIILFLFDNFCYFKVIKKNFVKKHGYYEKIVLHYYFKNILVKVKINKSNINKKNIVIKSLNQITFDFDKNIIINNNRKITKQKYTSFDLLYLYLKNNKRLNYQNFNFHKKVLIEKDKILTQIKKTKI